MTSVSVIIPTHNRPAGLTDMMRDLRAQTIALSEFEVIVVDSVDGEDVSDIVHAARREGVNTRRLLTPNIVAAKRNAGARAARGDLLLFADDDMRLPPAWIESHFLAHAGRRRAMVSGAVVFPDDWIATSNYYRYKNSRHLNSTRPTIGRRIEAHRVVTMNASIPRLLYLSVGGISEPFTRYGGEDVEFGFRLEREGVALLYSQTALAEHHEVTTDIFGYMQKIQTASLAGAMVLSLAPEAAVAPTFRWTEPGVARSTADRLVHLVLRVLSRAAAVNSLAKALKVTDGWRWAYCPTAYKALTLMATQRGVLLRNQLDTTAES